MEMWKFSRSPSEMTFFCQQTSGTRRRICAPRSVASVHSLILFRTTDRRIWTGSSGFSSRMYTSFIVSLSSSEGSRELLRCVQAAYGIHIYGSRVSKKEADNFIRWPEKVTRSSRCNWWLTRADSNGLVPASTAEQRRFHWSCALRCPSTDLNSRVARCKLLNSILAVWDIFRSSMVSTRRREGLVFPNVGRRTELTSKHRSDKDPHSIALVWRHTIKPTTIDRVDGRAFLCCHLRMTCFD